MLSMAPARSTPALAPWRTVWLLVVLTMALALALGGLAILGARNPLVRTPDPMRASAFLPTSCPVGSHLEPGDIATVAGGPPGSRDDGVPALQAALSLDTGSLAVGPDGDLFVTSPSLRAVRRIAPDGRITTVASAGTDLSLAGPSGIAVDGAGNVFVADPAGARIWRLAVDGTATIVVGTGSGATAGPAGDGGPGAAATTMATSLAVGPRGEVYFDGPYRYRVLGADGRVRAFAGSGEPGYSGDGGSAVDARFRNVIGVATDAAGNVYLGDTGNHRIRKVDPDGVITTVAGSGVKGYAGDGGPATEAALNDPVGSAISGDGTIYFADAFNDVVRKVDPHGIVSTVAGTGVQGHGGDCGPATEAMLDEPWAVALGDGVLYILDGSDRIRMLVL